MFGEIVKEIICANNNNSDFRSFLKETCAKINESLIQKTAKWRKTIVENV